MFSLSFLSHVLSLSFSLTCSLSPFLSHVLSLTQIVVSINTTIALFRTISYIYNGELISYSHQNNAVCFLVIKKVRPWSCWSLHDNMFSIFCSQRVRNIPAVLKLLCYFQPIMLRLWMIQVTFVNKFVPYRFAGLTYYSSCNAESFYGGKWLSHLCFLFLDIWCNPR